MIEHKQTILEDDTSLHSDILYAVLLAINLNHATTVMDNTKMGELPDKQAIDAITTSAQLPNVLAMSSALTMCVRTLLVNNTIDFDKEFELMWESHSILQGQLTKEKCKEFFTHALDLGSSIMLDS